MEDYYSSDEEIAWGRITLREIKGDLKRPRQKPNRRHTETYTFPMDSLTKANTGCNDIPASEDICSCQEEMDKLNISPASTQYFTPNDSLRTNDHQYNSDFFNKLSNIINEPSINSQKLSTFSTALDSTKTSVSTNECYMSLVNSENLNSSYGTAVDITSNTSNMNITYLNFIKTATERETYYDIDKFRQTLVSNTILLENDKVDNQNLDDKEDMSENENAYSGDGDRSEEVIEEISNETRADILASNRSIPKIVVQECTVNENVIFISDEESGDSEDNISNTSLQSNGEVMSVNSIISEDGKCSEDSSPKTTLKGITKEALTKTITIDDEQIQACNSFNSIENNSKEWKNNGLHKDTGTFNNEKLYRANNYEMKESETEERTTLNRIVSQMSPMIDEKRSLSTSPISLPDIDLAQFDDSSSKRSPQFNDTLEEMNRLLEQGLNYTMSDEESIIESTPVKNQANLETQFSSSNIISSSFSHIQPINHLSTSKSQTVRTPTIKTPSSVEKGHTPKYNLTYSKSTPDGNFKVPERPIRSKLVYSTSPKTSRNHLKNVISPVALYIKNSPRMVLKQNVPQRDLPRVVTTSKIPKMCKENFPDFPEVVYKPSKKQLVTKEKEIVIPPSLKKLNIKEPTVTKHRSKIGKILNESEVKKRLLQSDITNVSIDSSVLTEDVSVLTSKQAFIK